MLKRRAVLLQDEWTGAKQEVRWGMVTRAEIKPDGSSAVLRQEGKALHARILSPANAVFTVESTAPPTDRERDNKGTRLLTVRLAPQAEGSQTLAVLLWPEHGKPIEAVEITPLDDWK
jgi:hypothetical protein